MSERSFLAEVKRRNVWRAAALYVGAIWALAQGIASLGPAMGVPEWGTRWFVIAGAIGFPFWLAFAWFYEWTPEGFKREREIEPGESVTHRTGRKLDFIFIGVMALAIVLLLTDRFVLRRGVNQQAAVAISDKSIAVLPFVDMSQGKDQEYFSDGVSEELLNLLAKVDTLRVAARTSSFSFKGKDVPIPEIAKALRVAYVLEGSVRKAGDQVRITTQLIRAADGYHLWSETYDRKLEDIFAIQDEVAAKVVEQLKVKLLGGGPKALTTDPEAYALYLQARELRRRFTVEALKEAEALLRRALIIDPRYSPAWDGMAAILISQATLGLLSNKEGFHLAREAATQALAIDPDLASAHDRLGWIEAFADNDLASGAQHYQRALRLNPGNVDILNNAGSLLVALGRVEQAQTLQEAVCRRDPVNAPALVTLGHTLRMLGRFDSSIASHRKALALNPAQSVVRSSIGYALLQKGDPGGALAEIEQEPADIWKAVTLPMAYHALGRRSDSDAALDALIANHEKDAAYNIAYVHAFRGDADKAFEWLDKAVEYGDPGVSEIVAENLFARIHGDPRWLPFLRKIGKAPEQLAKIEFKVALPAEWQAEAAAAKAAAAQPAPAETKP